MRLVVAAVGTRMPSWVDDAFTEYARRLPGGMPLELREVNAVRRAKGANLEQAARAEGERLLGVLPPDACIIALERSGRRIDTSGLARQLDDWRMQGTSAVFLIGGPEGLSPACLERAQETWSLSDLTLAHPVARVVLAEQLWRAWSLLSNHPYHRGDA
ncbi:MAG: 23S rRNA (pseudouridine(1915)-N(3))-methyltransferase RlmH [Gammaproteobacteria bacterium]|jgi:23S rRNA (pseudouridine1915-N3)-methyltransferase|nr:23S rRNA (pseudouridine(1915)-N(3))-methyltransferase RlmH [Gammaproteobacteria bacterium]